MTPSQSGLAMTGKSAKSGKQEGKGDQGNNAGIMMCAGEQY